MKTIQGFTCWDSKSIYDVSAVDANHAQRSAFLATHTPPVLRQVNNKTFERHDVTSSEEDIFEALFSSGRDFDNVALTGDAGSGKSHIVRWLDNRTPRNAGRIVVTVPKYGTGLRSICESILAVADSPDLSRAREMLSSAKAVATLESAAVELRAALATVIELRATEIAPAASEEVAWLYGALPDALNDSVTKTFFQREGGAVHRLARLSISGRQVDDGLDDDAIEFGRDDLPLSPEARNGSADSVKELLAHLAADGEESERLRALALKVLNENLASARHRAFLHAEFSLKDVLLEVRRVLNAVDDPKTNKNKQKELVLFIEDLTVIHGLEKELESALTVEKRDDLCRMRAAIAITEGELRKQATLAERCKIYAVEASHREVDEVAFVGRYLNAIRLGGARLDKALTEAADPSDQSWVPNACEGCEFGDDCHNPDEGFGETADGHGIYPFRPEAIERMVKSSTGQRFNPRAIILNVVQPVMHGAAIELGAGEFPSASVLAGFPHNDDRGELRPQLSAAAAEQVQVHGENDSDRRHRALELWSRQPGSTGNLPRTVAQAFVMPPIDALEVLELRTQKKGNGPVDPVEEVIPFAELDDWAAKSGRRLPSGLANEIRKLACAAVASHIRDRPGGWRLAAGEGKPLLQPESFRISNAQGGNRGSPVIEIEINPSPRLALIFRAALRARQGEDWDAARLAQWGNLVDGWAELALRRAERHFSDPSVRESVETLVYLSRCLGSDGGDDSPHAVLGGALGLGRPDHDDRTAFTGAFVEIAAQNSTQRLVNSLRQRYGAAKGTGATLAVDAAALLPIVAKAVDTWRFADLDGDTDASDVRRRVNRELQPRRTAAEAGLAETKATLELLGDERLDGVISATLTLVKQIEDSHLDIPDSHLGLLRGLADEASSANPDDVRQSTIEHEFDDDSAADRRRRLALLARDLPQRVGPLSRFCKLGADLCDRVEELTTGRDEPIDGPDLEQLVASVDAVVTSVEEISEVPK